MPDIEFFDCNCLIGPRGKPRPESNLSISETFAELARHGITEALCVHSLARELDPEIGNQALVDLDLSGQPVSVARCFVLMPHHTGEMARGEGLKSYLRGRHAAAVRLYPSDHYYDLTETSCGPMLEVLEDLGLPVLIDIGQTSWAQLDTLLNSHRLLHLVACRIGYRDDRKAYPVLERHSRLMLETSYYVGHRAIEHFVATFGHGRLLFGTGLPDYAPGGAISPVMYAAISDEARAAIAGGNLRGLIRGAGVPA